MKRFPSYFASTLFQCLVRLFYCLPGAGTEQQWVAVRGEGYVFFCNLRQEGTRNMRRTAPQQLETNSEAEAYDSVDRWLSNHAVE